MVAPIIRLLSSVNSFVVPMLSMLLAASVLASPTVLSVLPIKTPSTLPDVDDESHSCVLQLLTVAVTDADSRSADDSANSAYECSINPSILSASQHNNNEQER